LLSLRGDKNNNVVLLSTKQSQKQDCFTAFAMTKNCLNMESPQQFADAIKTKTFGCRIHYYESIGSTNLLARELAKGNAPEGTLVIAEEQSQGRGRNNRSWFSPAGESLLFSIILKPDWEPNHAPRLTAIAAIAVAEGIRKSTGLPALIKWPNDIRVHSKKVAGILTELEVVRSKVKFAIVGIGVNISIKKNEFPEEFRNQSSSLQIELKKRSAISRAKVIAEIMKYFELHYFQCLKEGTKSAMIEWKRLSDTLGKLVQIEGAKHKTTGYVADIDLDGSLIVRSSSGIVTKLVGGEITLLE
jgi:BirA family transcriptional regulator, biotin operon repressor / biotin---[acetyl-CoA-carboxylase] ligase